ncbi:MAG: UDP-2,4-diacetamido-2,4,6-trideoxy-beta-L-altropyranose hydrolase [Lachnospiraceae bacterium]
MNKTLYIRTEVNRITATGHMMRMLSVATAARKLGCEAVFIVAEEGSMAIPQSQGFEVICLNRTWDDFDGEIPLMQQLIVQQQIEYLLIDSYFVSPKYMEAVNALTRTAYVDDLHERIWPCSVLINYAVYSDLFDYEKEYAGKELLLGCRYCPLSEIYEELPPKEIRKEPKQVLVVTGGGDEFHFMKQFLSQIRTSRRFSHIAFLCICGKFHADLAELEEMTRSMENVTVLSQLPNLKDAILSSDVVITAGGTTLYEIACCRTPALSFSLADNQLYNVKGFAEQGYIPYLGDVRESMDFEQVLLQLEQLLQDYEKRIYYANRLGQLVDGKGAGRLVRDFLNMME